MNGNRDALPFDGMADAEVERRMKVCSFHDSNFGFLFLNSSILQKKNTSNNNLWQLLAQFLKKIVIYITKSFDRNFSLQNILYHGSTNPIWP